MSEEVKPVETPASVEQQLVQETRADEDNQDPVEIAAKMLTLYTPRYKALVDGLSSRQLKRLNKSLVEFPLGTMYNHTDEKEKQAFILGKALMDAKYVMIAQTYADNRERILNEAAKAAGNDEGSKENG